MPLVAGVDSSTQSCKVVVRDAESGALVRSGTASHPDGTEVDPAAWWTALRQAIERAGGVDDVAAVSVAGQQHGMVCLAEDGSVVRPALLWNDTRSAPAAEALVAELGGPAAWADAIGVVPVASVTVTKLRWLAEHEPDAAARTAAVCLPHDYLTWRLRGDPDLATLVTDRGDASGTGYYAPATGTYRPDLLELAMGRVPELPTVLGPSDTAGRLPSGAILGAGTGDNMAAALGVGAEPGDVVVSIGTSGTVFAVADKPSADPAGLVAGFADATGRFLPLVCTLNAARVLDATARMMSVDHDTFADLALAAPPGADGLVLVPYLEGERTPNLPTATGALHGLRLANATPAHQARAAVEGMLCGLADALDALVAQGVRVERVLLVGGAARSVAVQQVAPTVLGRPVLVPEPGEYVADGAARQAAWALIGTDHPPAWRLGGLERVDGEPTPGLRERYAEARGRVLDRPA
ncbi:xylulokinase [Actinophytocola gossypii]|uniref:Xylulose kinase n=1 Tax=Actinophytocola gossypii TaxID=2812003 RepID=A0ABT2JFB9_9PSEU|nr:xylulokinase [Actinophytocola gossypii]MCT2586135.1 xylulokinase [Actinophytocola gossypii]